MLQGDGKTAFRVVDGRFFCVREWLQKARFDVTEDEKILKIMVLLTEKSEQEAIEWKEADVDKEAFSASIGGLVSTEVMIEEVSRAGSVDYVLRIYSVGDCPVGEWEFPSWHSIPERDDYKVAKRFFGVARSIARHAKIVIDGVLRDLGVEEDE